MPEKTCVNNKDLFYSGGLQKQRKLSRRIKLSCILGLALCVVFALSACSMGNIEQKYSVTPALGDSYEKAIETLTEHDINDAKLIAIQSSRALHEDEPVAWMYLFGSPERSLTYTVFLDSNVATVAEYGSISLTDTEWTSIISLADITYDADAAFRKALEVLSDSDDFSSVNISLVLHDDNPEDTSVEKLLWYFDFNLSDANTTDNSYPAFAVSVDALSGNAVKI